MPGKIRKKRKRMKAVRPMKDVHKRGRNYSECVIVSLYEARTVECRQGIAKPTIVTCPAAIALLREKQNASAVRHGSEAPELTLAPEQSTMRLEASQEHNAALAMLYGQKARLRKLARQGKPIDGTRLAAIEADIVRIAAIPIRASAAARQELRDILRAADKRGCKCKARECGRKFDGDTGKPIPGSGGVWFTLSGRPDNKLDSDLKTASHIFEFVTFRPAMSTGTSEYMPEDRKPRPASNRDRLADGPNDCARQYGPNDQQMNGASVPVRVVNRGFLGHKVIHNGPVGVYLAE